MDINTIKYKFKHAGIVEQLIYINLAIYLCAFLSNTLSFLFQADSNFLITWFSLPENFNDFLSKPWSIITYGFLHTGFIHILLNLIVLFYIGNFFLDYFSQKQLLLFYILGTVVGGLIFLVAYNSFPVFINDPKYNVLLGASAGISAIFIGLATYLPNYQLKFPLIGFIKLWHLAAFWVALDIIQIPAGNAGGHLAHLGGGLFGFLYVFYASNKEIDVFSPIINLFKKEPHLKTVHKSEQQETRTSKYSTKDEHQQEIDKILDKIGKSGYDALSKEEKEFLFKQGKR